MTGVAAEVGLETPRGFCLVVVRSSEIIWSPKEGLSSTGMENEWVSSSNGWSGGDNKVRLVVEKW